MKAETIARRARARRLVVQALYQIELGGQTMGSVTAQYDTDKSFEKADREYFDILLATSIEYVDEITLALSRASDVDIRTMDPVERALVTVGACEILYMDDTDRTVAISEAVRLAKKFGATESHRFVNGVLDNLQAQ